MRATTRGALRPVYHEPLAICRVPRWMRMTSHRMCGVREDRRAATLVSVSRTGCSTLDSPTRALIAPGPSDICGDSISPQMPSRWPVSSSTRTISSLNPSSARSGPAQPTAIVFDRRVAAERSVRTRAGYGMQLRQRASFQSVCKRQFAARGTASASTEDSSRSGYAPAAPPGERSSYVCFSCSGSGSAS
jgi:hypothetical protein